MSTHDIPAYLTAAARLGAARELGQALVLSVFDGARHLYLAERRGSVRYSSPVWVDPPGSHVHTIRERRVDNSSVNGLHLLAREHVHGKHRILPAEQRITRERWFVIDYLGSEPAHRRSTALADADSLGVLILEWPGERLRYVVEWPGCPLRGVQIVDADDVDPNGQQSLA